MSKEGSESEGTAHKEQKEADEYAYARHLSSLTTSALVRQAKESSNAPANMVFSSQDRAVLIHAMLLEWANGIE